jgi:signal transduction histidine kinase/CheY-like chemotaxis protein
VTKLLSKIHQFIKKPLSIRAYTLVVIIGVVIPSSAWILFDAARDVQRERELAYDLLATNLRRQSNFVSRWINQSEYRLAALAENQKSAILDCPRAMRTQLEIDSLVLSILVINSNQRLVCQESIATLDPEVIQAYVEENPLQPPIFGDRIVIVGPTKLSSGQIVIALKRAAVDSDGQVFGVVAFIVDFRALSSFALRDVDSKFMAAVISNEDDAVIMRWPDLDGDFARQAVNIQASSQLSSEGAVGELIDASGVASLVSVTNIPGTNWRLAIWADRIKLLGESNRRATAVILGALAAVLASAAWIWWGSQRIYKPIERMASLVRTGSGSMLDSELKSAPTEIAEIVRSIVELNRIVADSEKWHREILEASPVPCVIFHHEKVEYLNPAYTRLLGYTLQDISSLDDWFALGYPNPVERLTHRKSVISYLESSTDSLSVPNNGINNLPVPSKFVCHAKNGKRLTVNGYITPLPSFRGRFLSTVVDVTREVELQTKVAHAERITALGQLTGGIAHDVNNDLAVILGAAELINEKADAGSRFGVLSQRIIATVERSASLVQRMLAFSRKSNIEPVNLDFGKAVGEIVEAMRRTLGGRIELCYSPSPDSVWVHVDRSLLESSLINLAVNARDAMPGGGTLTFAVSTERRDIGGGMSNWVALSAADTGIGMSEDVRKRVFEPFFTTKPMGGGTGLGLSTVYGFVHQSGGDIDVQSEVGKGSTFTILLPQIAPPDASRRAGGAGDAGPADVGKTVLIVEDNELLRTTLKEQLQDIGCQVFEAGTVEEARAIISQRTDLDYILSDLDLGKGPSGVDLAEWVNQQGYQIPGAIISGYLNAPIEKITAAGWSHLQKPIQLKQLIAILS